MDDTNSTRLRTNAPIRANQSSKLEYQTPRTFEPGRSKSSFPPPPTVEDEVESLAREHGSSVVSADEEQAKYPGDVEQFPIIQEVPENNPERRFVLVPNSGSSEASQASGTDGEGKTGKDKEGYEANTCRKYVVITSDDEADAKPGRELPRRPGAERRRSRQDLPRINTEMRQEERIPSSARDRRKSTTERPPADYFNGREPSQRTRDGLLSPVITSKHSTKGRDRAYYEDGGLNRSASRRRAPSADRRGLSVDERRRGEAYRGAHSLDPPAHKRTTSSAETPRYEHRSAANSRNREETFPSRGTKYGSPPRKRRDSSSAPRPNRKSISPPYPPSARDRERLPTRSPSFKGRRGRRADDDYSEDDYPHVPTSRRPQIHQEDIQNLLSPDQARLPAFSKPKPRDTTSPVTASPRADPGDFPEFVAPALGASSRAATLPYHSDPRRVRERPIPALSPSVSSPQPPTSRMTDDPEPSRSKGRSRASSIIAAQVGAAVGAAAGAALPILTASGNSTTVDRDKPPIPPPHGSSPKQQQQWQPPGLHPTDHRAKEKPDLPYRRYSQDIEHGHVTPWPDCPRTTKVAGHYDWLTVPNARGFVICPTCYEQIFANTQFRHSFIPAPPLPTPMSCNFGSSHWYRIAWLMTLKNGYPDLRLFQNIAMVQTQQQECPSHREASRIWYSILDPESRRPVETLTVCPHCAKTIEVILPSLYGVFIPLTAPPVPTRGVCDMHFAPGRKRFLRIFDLLENTSDKAVARKGPIDHQELADQTRRIPLDCARDEPMRKQDWHVMEAISEFTVCKECFEEVVRPILEGDRPSRVARNFYRKPQPRPEAACQLYSDRMRDIFRKACQRDDLHLLEDMVRERLDIEASIQAKLLQRPSEAEVRELRKEWERWE